MTTANSTRKFYPGTTVFVKVWDGDCHEYTEVRGLVLEDGVRMADLRTGTVATFSVADSQLRVRNEEARKVWTCAVGGKDIFTWI